MPVLKAKKFTAEKFTAPGGYIMLEGHWGVIHTETNQWVTFDNKAPYTPQGGRKACVEVAQDCVPTELSYLSTLPNN